MKLTNVTNTLTALAMCQSRIFSEVYSKIIFSQQAGLFQRSNDWVHWSPNSVVQTSYIVAICTRFFVMSGIWKGQITFTKRYLFWSTSILFELEFLDVEWIAHSFKSFRFQVISIDHSSLIILLNLVKVMVRISKQ